MRSVRGLLPVISGTGLALVLTHMGVHWNYRAPYTTNKGPTNDDRFKGMQFKTNPCKRGRFARELAPRAQARACRALRCCLRRPCLQARLQM